MPVYQRPNVIISVTLPCEDNKPEADRIHWQCRVMTGEEAIAYEFAHADAVRVSDTKAANEKVNAVILSIASGWDLVDEVSSPIPFSSESLSRYFSLAQRWIISRQLPDALLMGELEKKA